MVPALSRILFQDAGLDGSALELNSHSETLVANTAPVICANMNGKTEIGEMPAKLSLIERAIVTAGFAKLVEAVNQ